MADTLPDYSTVEVPAEKPPSEYSHHERRASLLRRCISMGSPFAVSQTNQAERYSVHRSTISRDMKRLRESVGEHLAADAKLTSKTVFERALLDLRQADDWKASKAAVDMVLDWNKWLQDIGEQEREPDRSELDVDMRSRRSEVSYRIVREGEEDPLPTTETEDGSETVDYEELGFSSGPSEIDVTAEEIDE